MPILSPNKLSIYLSPKEGLGEPGTQTVTLRVTKETNKVKKKTFDFQTCEDKSIFESICFVFLYCWRLFPAACSTFSNVLILGFTEQQLSSFSVTRSEKIPALIVKYVMTKFGGARLGCTTSQGSKTIGRIVFFGTVK